MVPQKLLPRISRYSQPLGQDTAVITAASLDELKRIRAYRAGVDTAGTFTHSYSPLDRPKSTADSGMNAAIAKVVGKFTFATEWEKLSYINEYKKVFLGRDYWILRPRILKYEPVNFDRYIYALEKQLDLEKLIYMAACARSSGLEFDPGPGKITSDVPYYHTSQRWMVSCTYDRYFSGYNASRIAAFAKAIMDSSELMFGMTYEQARRLLDLSRLFNLDYLLGEISKVTNRFMDAVDVWCSTPVIISVDKLTNPDVNTWDVPNDIKVALTDFDNYPIIPLSSVQAQSVKDFIANSIMGWSNYKGQLNAEDRLTSQNLSTIDQAINKLSLTVDQINSLSAVSPANFLKLTWKAATEVVAGQLLNASAAYLEKSSADYIPTAEEAQRYSDPEQNLFLSIDLALSKESGFPVFREIGTAPAKLPQIIERPDLSYKLDYYLKAPDLVYNVKREPVLPGGGYASNIETGTPAKAGILPWLIGGAAAFYAYTQFR